MILHVRGISMRCVVTAGTTLFHLTGFLPLHTSCWWTETWSEGPNHLHGHVQTNGARTVGQLSHNGSVYLLQWVPGSPAAAAKATSDGPHFRRDLLE